MARSMITIRSKVLIALTAAGALVAAMVLAASPAFANTDPSSSCPILSGGGYDCIFYGESYNGSHTGVYYSNPDFPVSGSTQWVYLSSGAGQGEYLGNNNGSNRNTDRTDPLHIWYSPDSSGYEVTLSPYGTSGYEKAGSQLGHLLNNIRSQSWG